jgi:hypothetical protein
MTRASIPGLNIFDQGIQRVPSRKGPGFLVVRKFGSTLEYVAYFDDQEKAAQHAEKEAQTLEQTHFVLPVATAFTIP